MIVSSISRPLSGRSASALSSFFDGSVEAASTNPADERIATAKILIIPFFV